MIDPQLADDEQLVSPRTLRQFAALWLVFFAGLSVWHGLKGHTVREIVFGFLAVSVGPLGIARPETIQPLFTALIAITQPIGIVMTRILLGVLFYGLFTPIAVVFRLIGRDALDRRRSSTNTYWKPRDSNTDVRRYLRQYLTQAARPRARFAGRREHS